MLCNRLASFVPSFPDFAFSSRQKASEIERMGNAGQLSMFTVIHLITLGVGFSQSNHIRLPLRDKEADVVCAVAGAASPCCTCYLSTCIYVVMDALSDRLFYNHICYGYVQIIAHLLIISVICLNSQILLVEQIKESKSQGILYTLRRQCMNQESNTVQV